MQTSQNWIAVNPATGYLATFVVFTVSSALSRLSLFPKYSGGARQRRAGAEPQTRWMQARARSDLGAVAPQRLSLSVPQSPCASVILRHGFAPMAAAQRDITLVAANLHLITFENGAPLGILADHHGGLFTAMADSADLAHFIGQCQ